MKKNKLLVVASNGGHLVQLTRLQDAFINNDISLVSTSRTPPTNFECDRYYSVLDSNNTEKLKLIVTAIQTLIVFIKVRPKVVVSTGAAPGLFFVFWAKIFGAHGVWIDSIANTQELSMAGKLARKLTTECYSQWPDVAQTYNVKHLGSVL